MIARALIRDRDGTSAVEFALVLPLLLLFIFGMIDAGRFLWECNQAEKATQAGARVAVVTDVIPGGMVTSQYVGVSGLTQGDRIPASALGKISCNSVSGTVSCGCVPPDGAPPCPSLGTANATAFNRVVTRMRNMKPGITAANVLIEYRGSGLGFAGDPDPLKPQISPLVTVRLTRLQFVPLSGFMFVTLPMPDFLTTLTAEDSSGTQSN
ncbi:MAG: TadE/TadG family type IV pilus assembly protein [Sphingomicrobium sp.]